MLAVLPGQVGLPSWRMAKPVSGPGTRPGTLLIARAPQTPWRRS